MLPVLPWFSLTCGKPAELKIKFAACQLVLQLSCKLTDLAVYYLAWVTDLLCILYEQAKCKFDSLGTLQLCSMILTGNTHPFDSNRTKPGPGQGRFPKRVQAEKTIKQTC